MPCLCRKSVCSFRHLCYTLCWKSVSYCYHLCNKSVHYFYPLYHTISGRNWLVVRFRDLETKKIRAEIFKGLWNVGLEKIKWSQRVTNGELLEHTGEKRMLLNNIQNRKVNWMGHILRRNSLLHDAIEGQITEVKGVWKRRLAFWWFEK